MAPSNADYEAMEIADMDADEWRERVKAAFTAGYTANGRAYYDEELEEAWQYHIKGKEDLL